VRHHHYSRAGVAELRRELVRVVEGQRGQDLRRHRRLDEILRVLEPEAGDLADGLDHGDLVGSGHDQHHVEATRHRGQPARRELLRQLEESRRTVVQQGLEPEVVTSRIAALLEPVRVDRARLGVVGVRRDRREERLLGIVRHPNTLAHSLL
jgi:hypothetical protein